MPFFLCTSCSTPITTNENQTGKTIQCPHCNQPTKLLAAGKSKATALKESKTVSSTAKRETSKIGIGAITPLKRKRKKSFFTPAVGLGICVAIIAGVAVYLNNNSPPSEVANATLEKQTNQPEKSLTKVPEKPHTVLIEPIADQTLKVGETLTLEVLAKISNTTDQQLTYTLGPQSPSSVNLHPETGAISWSPKSEEGHKTHTISIVVSEPSNNAVTNSFSFNVHVSPEDTPIDLFVQDLKEAGLLVENKGKRSQPLFEDRDCHVLNVAGSDLFIVEYASKEAAQKDAKRISLNSKELFPSRDERAHLFRTNQLIAYYPGKDSTLLLHLDSILGRPFVSIRGTGPMLASTSVSTISADGKAIAGEFRVPGMFNEEEAKILQDLYDKKALFSPKSYSTLRTLFANQFAKKHEEDLHAAFGDEYDNMMVFFEENPALRDELFNAIDPEKDKVRKALSLFKDLKYQYSQKIVQYGNLAIAIAVTWDNPRAIYDYGGHQRRAKTTLPDGLTGPMENFEHFVNTESVMQGRAQWLPWEFLVHTVNHKTPIIEREWALANYVAKRAMFGKCYHDVPYDTMMLETKSEKGKLNGQVYTLPNIRGYGGVCAHQADFSSRVGQSLGVPAALVSGTSSFGEGHAWVMWVEINAVSPTSIAFKLESHGRYRGDKYYVGRLKDPKTGDRITDRQLELRLHTVGLSPLAKRQAELVMRTYPYFIKAKSLSVSDQFDFLGQTVQFCPGNETAWKAIAKLASNEVVRTKHKKQMLQYVNQLFINFARFPDFTWVVFDDLAKFEEDPKRKIALYNRLVGMYIAAKRPDLAIQARMSLTDLLVDEGEQLAAINGLALTIYAFADDGRFVPKMLDRLEAICEDVEGSTPALLAFYNTFLPKIPQKRGSRPSQHCIKMFERGIRIFKEHNQPQAAVPYQNTLVLLKAK